MIINAIVAFETFRDETLAAFRKEEDGLALTEYLILLGLLVGAVIVAVGAFGTNLNAAWEAWEDYIAGIPTPEVVVDDGNG